MNYVANKLGMFGSKPGVIGFLVAAVGLANPALAQQPTPLPTTPEQDWNQSQPLPPAANNSILVPPSLDPPRRTPADFSIWNRPAAAAISPVPTPPAVNRNLPPLQRTVPSPESVVEDIAGIRRSIGGGVSESLKGLIANDQELQTAARQDFEDELKRLTLQKVLEQQRLSRRSAFETRLRLMQIAKQERQKSIQNRQAAENNPSPLPPSVSNYSSQRQPANQANDNSGPQLPGRIAEPGPQANWGAQARMVDPPRFNPRVNPVNYNAPVVSVFTPVVSVTQPKMSPTQQLRDAAVKLEQMAAQFEESELYQEADEVREQAQNLWLKARDVGKETVGRTTETQTRGIGPARREVGPLFNNASDN